MNKREAAKGARLPQVKTLREIGFSKDQISKWTDVTPTTTSNDLETLGLDKLQTKRELDLFKSAVKHYAKLSLGLVVEIERIKVLLRDWIGLGEFLKNDFSSIDKIAVTVKLSDNCERYRGYINLLYAIFEHGCHEDCGCWRRLMEDFDQRQWRDLPISDFQVRSDFKSQWIEEYRDHTGRIWETKAKQEHHKLLLESAFEDMDEQKRLIIRKRFGLDDEALAYEDVGRQLNIDPIIVAQIEKEALNDLRHSKYTEELRSLHFSCE